MSKHSVAILSLCLFSGLPLAAQEDGLHWHDNYKAALEEAKKTGKPLFIEYRCEP